MYTTIENIGNSKGVILPKQFLVTCAIEHEISIEVKDHTIVITSIAPEPVKRQGWGKAISEMAEKGDDELLIPDVFNDENIDDWTWK